MNWLRKSPPKESALQRRVLNLLRKEDVFVRKWSDRFSKGIPDIFFIYKGRAFFIELKTPGGVATKIQEATIDEIRRSGAKAKICYGYEEAKAFIEEALR